MDLKLNITKKGISLGTAEAITNEEFALHYGHIFRGKDGRDGVDGKSAYEYANEAGYDKSEADFAIDLSKVDTIPSKADKDGYYPAMSVGMADELVGRGDVQDAYINFRPSGGVNKNIKDGAARVKAIKGNSVVWNNIASPLSDITQRPNWSLEYEGGILYGTVTTAAPSYLISVQISAHNTIPNHTYLVYIKTSNSEGVESLNMYFGGEYPAIAANGTTIVTATSADKIYIYPFSSIGSSIGVGASFTIEKLQIVDLTLMFGAGDEPKTIEEFNERKPMNIKDEFAYNAGEIIDMHANELVSTSDNAYNPAEKKAYVMPNAKYHITDSANSEFIEIIFSYYDADGSLILDADFDIVEEDGKTYHLFPQAGWVEVNMAQGDICVCLSHSYDKPHPAFQQDVKDLSFIGEAFTEGMRSAGSAFDEIRFNPTKKKWEAVKRIGEVDLGSFTWRIGATVDTSKGVKRIDSEEHLPNMKTPTSNSIKANFLCKRYTAATADSVYLNVPMTVGVNTNGSIQIYDTEYNANDGSDLIAFKQAMQGVKLYYELAEPIVVELDYPTEETNMDYRVWDFGTEEAITSEPSAPFRAGVEYGFNATDDIRTLLKRVAELEAKLTQLTNE